jgi:hypothetical protein
MNTFLIFVILLIFIYEFNRRIKYLDSNTIEKFQEIPLSNMTYLPYNFSQGYSNNLNIKDISKDLGVKRSINQVKSATYEDPPSEFFKPLDIKLFRRDLPKWTVSQRPWIESYTYLDDVVKQKDDILDFKIKNQDLLSTWEKIELENKFTPVPTSY